MRASRAEIKIEEILQMQGVNFKQEYQFPDLVSFNGNPLRFDFAIFDDYGQLDFLIEYQGQQHYIAKGIYGGVGGLKRQQYNDMLKRQYCRKHNINLLLIPYWDFGRISYDYIMNSAQASAKI